MKRLLVLLVALSSLARAADFPHIVQQGFSRDARYHLLVTSWIQDGSGFPAAALQITDVRRNAVAYRLQHTWKQDGVSAARLAALVRTWRAGQLNVLKRYSLISPLPGERLFNVLPQSGYPSAAPISTLTKAGTFTLTSLPLASKCTFSDRPTLGLALTLGGRELQRDTRLPASRACASGYRLETAYRYKSGLAVIVRAYSQGFEGPDALPLVVTAALK
ncbi:DUF2259 domain-containing protein [Deinococcus rubellus]|uniref:DUF2259 domain-containing protein n=1 Tax=Deinococcus rubellus TaxID=1889240 RepID=A0ABY5YGE4_9DEIO|nr:DUF2259 domain-containing protein [Deinococcus rubellus]UWX62903.1 DUF2259 domain-containing protein [Deinococcus rubellus]